MTDELNREVREIGSRKEWQDWRRKDLTASRVAALFEGADPYARLEDLVAHIAGTAEKREQTASMRAGIIAEAMFPEAVALERPEWKLTKATTYHRLPQARLGCTPDFWVGEDGLLQAKTCNERVWESWQGRPPLGYTLQTLVELLVTGREWGVLAVIVRNSELPLHLFEVPRHPAAEARILDAVAEFWRKFDAGEFPVPMPVDAIAAMLDDGSHIDLSGDNRLPEWLERREGLVAERSGCEREIKNLDYEIKQRMGRASTGWLEGWQISWKSQHRKEYTVPEADIRVLRIKRTQETDNADA